MANKRFLVGDVKIEGLEQVIAELRKRGADVVAGVEAICVAGAEVVQDAIEARAPGGLADDMLHETTVRNGPKVVVSVGVAKKRNYIARFQEFGVKGHVIPKAKRRRRKVKVLKFAGRYVRRIVHPGHGPQPFLRPGYESSKGQAQDAMGSKTKQIIKA